MSDLVSLQTGRHRKSDLPSFRNPSLKYPVRQSRVVEDPRTMTTALKVKLALLILAPLTSLAAICAALYICINEFSPTNASSAVAANQSLDSITGAGVASMAQILSQWMSLFQSLKSNERSPYEFSFRYYMDNWSGFSSGKVLFEVSDGNRFLSYNNSSSQSDAIVTFPVVAGAVVIIYNLFNASESAVVSNSTVTLTASVLQSIFDGSIAWWNDTRITTLNPEKIFPSHRISAIIRSDSTILTKIFLDYVSPSTFSNTTFGKLPSNGFITVASDIETFYASISTPYSIAYTSVDMVAQASQLGYNPQIALVVNANQKPVYPTYKTINAAIIETTSTDSSNDAYPMVFFQNVTMRKSYIGTNTQCLQVKYLVEMWEFVLQGQITGSEEGGWTPVSGPLLDAALELLETVTCNGVNIAAQIHLDAAEDLFYFDASDYDNGNSLTIWNNPESFIISPVSASIYVFFYALLVVSNGVPFLQNMIIYLRRRKQKTRNKDHKVSFSIHKEENRQIKLKDGDADVSGDDNDSEDEDEDNEGEGKDNDEKQAGKVSFTLQNRLAIFTQFFTCFQIISLCLRRSQVVQNNSYVDAISWIGMIPNSFAFCIFLECIVVLWLLCMVYTTYIYGLVEQYFPQMLIHLTSFHTFLAEFLPSFSVILYNPSIELLASVLDCRLSRRSWTYVNGYHEECWKEWHWVNAVVCIVLVCMFTNFVVRYCKILKILRKDFDFKDQEWCIHLESVTKTFLIVVYFNSPNAVFLACSFVITLFLSACSLYGKPNAIFWYNYLRGGTYLYCGAFSLILFILESVVDGADYALRQRISDILTLGVLIVTISVWLFVFKYVGDMYKAGLSNREKAMQQEALKKFFAAFGDEGDFGSKVAPALDIDDMLRMTTGTEPAGYNSQVVSRIPIISNATNNIGLHSTNTHGSSFVDIRISPAGNETDSGHDMSGHNMEAYFSQDQWSKFEDLLLRAKRIGLIEKEEARALKRAIKFEDPLIPYLYIRSDKNLNTFIEMIQSRVHDIFAKSRIEESGRPSSVNTSTLLSLPSRRVSMAFATAASTISGGALSHTSSQSLFSNSRRASARATSNTNLQTSSSALGRQTSFLKVHVGGGGGPRRVSSSSTQSDTVHRSIGHPDRDLLPLKTLSVNTGSHRPSAQPTGFLTPISEDPASATRINTVAPLASLLVPEFHVAPALANGTVRIQTDTLAVSSLVVPEVHVIAASPKNSIYEDSKAVKRVGEGNGKKEKEVAQNTNAAVKHKLRNDEIRDGALDDKTSMNPPVVDAVDYAKKPASVRNSIDGSQFPVVQINIPVPVSAAKTVDYDDSSSDKKSRAIALWEYEAVDEDEISFKAGDLIRIIEICNEHWCEGVVDGKQGYFPKNRVQLVSDDL